MSSRSISTKKQVSSGAATQRMAQQSRVAASLPLAVKRSPTWRVCRARRVRTRGRRCGEALRSVDHALPIIMHVG